MSLSESLKVVFLFAATLCLWITIVSSCISDQECANLVCSDLTMVGACRFLTPCTTFTYACYSMRADCRCDQLPCTSTDECSRLTEKCSSHGMVVHCSSHKCTCSHG